MEISDKLARRFFTPQERATEENILSIEAAEHGAGKMFMAN